MSDDGPIDLTCFCRAIQELWLALDPEAGVSYEVDQETQTAAVTGIMGDIVDLRYDDTDLLLVDIHHDAPEPGDLIKLVFRPIYGDPVRFQAEIRHIVNTITNQIPW